MGKSAENLADTIVSAIPDIESKRKRKTTRFQLSLTTLAMLAEKEFLSQIYLGQLSGALVDRGWLMFQTNHSRYAFILFKAANNWPKFSSKRFQGSETDGSDEEN